MLPLALQLTSNGFHRSYHWKKEKNFSTKINSACVSAALFRFYSECIVQNVWEWFKSDDFFYQILQSQVMTTSQPDHKYHILIGKPKKMLTFYLMFIKPSERVDAIIDFCLRRKSKHFGVVRVVSRNLIFGEIKTG